MTAEELINALRNLAPEVDLVRGCYVLRSEYADHVVEQWLSHYGGDAEATERMANHRHVASLVPWVTDGQDSEDLLFLAAFYASTLRCRLRELCPHAQFEVITEGAAEVETEPYDLIVTFHRRRDANPAT